MRVTNPNFRRSIALGVNLQLIQQFTTINVVIYFAPKSFQMAGFAATTEASRLRRGSAHFLAIAKAAFCTDAGTGQLRPPQDFFGLHPGCRA
jgi:ABC-type Fe3+ transport system permease subunit